MTFFHKTGPIVFFAMEHLGVVNEEELEHVCSERETTLDRPLHQWEREVIHLQLRNESLKAMRQVERLHIPSFENNMRNMKDECQKSFGTVIEKSEETNPLLSAAHREQYVDKALLPKLKSLSVATSSSLPTSWPRILVFVFVESRPPPSHS